jgi:hypothetical protein
VSRGRSVVPLSFLRMRALRFSCAVSCFAMVVPPCGGASAAAA